VSDLDTLARAATRELLDRTVPDIATRYAELRRNRTRRTTATLVGVAAAVGLAAGGWQLFGGPGEPVEPTPPTGKVTNGGLLGLNYTGQVHLQDWGTVYGDRPEHLPTDPQDDPMLQFAPDGSFVYYADDQGHLATWDLTTDEKQVLIDCPASRQQCWGSSVSPDGRTALFLAGRRILLQSLATGVQRAIRLPLGIYAAPVWSPDGRALAFTNEDGLYTVGADGSDLRLIHPATYRTEWPPYSVAWSPDGERIAFFDPFEDTLRGSPARYRAMTVSPDGSDPEVVHFAGWCACGAGSPPSLTWSPDGTLIAVATAQMTNGTGVYTVRPDGSEWTIRKAGDWAMLRWQPVLE
jgi:Tol biopolymer transport system component